MSITFSSLVQIEWLNLPIHIKTLSMRNFIKKIGFTFSDLFVFFIITFLQLGLTIFHFLSKLLAIQFLLSSTTFYFINLLKMNKNFSIDKFFLRFSTYFRTFSLKYKSYRSHVIFWKLLKDKTLYLPRPLRNKFLKFRYNSLIRFRLGRSL